MAGMTCATTLSNPVRRVRRATVRRRALAGRCDPRRPSAAITAPVAAGGADAGTGDWSRRDRPTGAFPLRSVAWQRSPVLNRRSGPRQNAPNAMPAAAATDDERQPEQGSRRPCRAPRLWCRVGADGAEVGAAPAAVDGLGHTPGTRRADAGKDRHICFFGAIAHDGVDAAVSSDAPTVRAAPACRARRAASVPRQSRLARRRAAACACARRTAAARARSVTPATSPGSVERGSPQLSRATGVSSRTGGTPAASASSGVRPSPSYSDRNANARADPYSVRARRRTRTAARSRGRSRPPARSRRPDVSGGRVRLSPTISRPRVRVRARDGAKARIRSGTRRRLKIEPTYSTCGRRRDPRARDGRRRRDAWRNHVDPRCRRRRGARRFRAARTRRS